MRLEPAYRAQEFDRTRQVADVPAQRGLERRDVEVEFLAPVVDAVPVERAPLGIETRVELADRLLGRHSMALAPVPRQRIEPEKVVEAQVQHRAVHVEADGAYRVPFGGNGAKFCDVRHVVWSALHGRLVMIRGALSGAGVP